MIQYHVKIDEEARTVTFRGITWGYGLGCELELWQYFPEGTSNILVVKKAGAGDSDYAR